MKLPVIKHLTRSRKFFKIENAITHKNRQLKVNTLFINECKKYYMEYGEDECLYKLLFLYLNYLEPFFNDLGYYLYFLMNPNYLKLFYKAHEWNRNIIMNKTFFSTMIDYIIEHKNRMMQCLKLLSKGLHQIKYKYVLIDIEMYPGRGIVYFDLNDNFKQLCNEYFTR